MKAATFSNGETFVRKTNTRDYQFAWAVIRYGVVVQRGFSCDRSRAEKAARTYLNRCNGTSDRNTRNPGLRRWYACPIAGAARRKCLEQRTADWANATIEVVACGV